MTLSFPVPRLGGHFILWLCAQVCSPAPPPGPQEQGARSGQGAWGPGEGRGPCCCSVVTEPGAQQNQDTASVP